MGAGGGKVGAQANGHLHLQGGEHVCMHVRQCMHAIYACTRACTCVRRLSGDGTLSESRLLKNEAGVTTTMETSTHACRCAGPVRAEKQSAATIRYEAAQPAQLTMTAQSMPIAVPELGNAASQTEASVTGLSLFALTLSPLEAKK